MDAPPSYPGSSSRTSSIPSPTYSATPSTSEYVLQSPPSGGSARSTSARDYVYKLKNAEINLGARVWGTSAPVYGGNGIVEGIVNLSDDVCNVASVSIKV